MRLVITELRGVLACPENRRGAANRQPTTRLGVRSLVRGAGRRRRCRAAARARKAARARVRTGDTTSKARAACRARHGRRGRPTTVAWSPGRGGLLLSQMGFARPGYRVGGRGSERVGPTGSAQTDR
jgi:hypothetical protein